jgi:hypothetical protein
MIVHNQEPGPGWVLQAAKVSIAFSQRTLENCFSAIRDFFRRPALQDTLQIGLIHS